MGRCDGILDEFLFFATLKDVQGAGINLLQQVEQECVDSGSQLAARELYPVPALLPNFGELRAQFDKRGAGFSHATALTGVLKHRPSAGRTAGCC